MTYEYAVDDRGHLVVVTDWTCPADVMRDTHGHGDVGPINILRRIPGGEWEQVPA